MYFKDFFNKIERVEGNPNICAVVYKRKDDNHFQALLNPIEVREELLH